MTSRVDSNGSNTAGGLPPVSLQTRFPDSPGGSPQVAPRAELDSLLQLVARLVTADAALLTVWDPRSRVARIHSFWGLADEVEQLTFMRGDGFVGRSLEADGPIVERFEDGVQDAFARNGDGLITDALGAPFRGVGEVSGALCVGFTRPPAMDPAALTRAMRSYGSLAGLCLEDPLGLAGLLRSSFEDELTGCLAHATLMQALSHEVRRCERYAADLSVCFLDLDGFKELNEERGHEWGNRALALAAAAIRGRVRDIDIVGRYGGDEFVILLPGTGAFGARILGEVLQKEIWESTARMLGCGVEASVGQCQWVPGLQVDGLLEEADRVMRKSKESAREEPPRYGRG